MGPPALRGKVKKRNSSMGGAVGARETEIESATQIIVESLLLGQPDDLTLLPNGKRIDRSGFL